MIKKGFTLVELIVAGFITSLIVLAATGPFVSLIQYQRESKNIDDLNDNIQVILNVLDKELRTASNVSYDGSTLSFQNQESQSVSYALSGDILRKTVDSNTINLTETSVFSVNEFVVDLKPSSVIAPLMITVTINAISLDGENDVLVQSTTVPRNN